MIKSKEYITRKINRNVWDEKLSFKEIGNNFYFSKKRGGKWIKIYGKILSIEKDFNTVKVVIQINKKQ